MAKRKKLNVATVEAELRLIACGAEGAPFVTDDGLFPTLLSMHPPHLAQFAQAILWNYFDGNHGGELRFMRITACEKWGSYATLAAEIVSERKRLDAEEET